VYRPPFDTTRAAFYLVAAVIGVYGVVVLMGAATCVWRIVSLPADSDFVCDPNGRLGELLAGALAAALAFAGGLRSKPPDPP
jgi:hypothetical protein